jgi:ribosome-associated protein
MLPENRQRTISSAGFGWSACCSPPGHKEPLVTIHLTETVTLDDSDIKERFVRAQGALGMNPDHAETGVELHFDIVHADLPAAVKTRLTTLAGRRITRDGALVVTSRAARSQVANRNAARARLLTLLLRASQEPKARRPTRPRRVVRERRLAEKRRRAEVKTLRAPEKSADQV